MTAFVLISGALLSAPQHKATKDGEAYVAATIRGKDAQLWSLTAFAESAQEELLRLRDGDCLAAQGVGTFEVHFGGRKPSLSLSLIADSITALRRPPQPPKKPEAATPPPDPRTPYPDLDEDMPPF
jgi:hypothetical protein